MLQITPQHKLLLAIAPIDFRNGIAGIVALCKSILVQDPFTGTLFIFRNRRKTAVKIVVYDGNGFWLSQKRFSKGTLKWWPTTEVSSITLRTSELQILLAQGNPEKAAIPEDWRRLPMPPVTEY